MNNESECQGCNEGIVRGRNTETYQIRNVASGLAIEGSVTSCSDQTHPRVFMATSDFSNHAQNWYISQVDGPYYTITNEFTGKALDGNTTIPNVDPSQPMPFTWTPVPTALNQHWIFPSAGTVDTFYLRNRVGSQLALNGNTLSVTQPCPDIMSPFLSAPSSNNSFQQWYISLVPARRL